MATTARPQVKPAFNRFNTTDTVGSTTSSPDGNSPFDSPARSPSTSSLSSLSSVGETKDESYGVLIDGYGNDFAVPDYTIKQLRDAIPAHCFNRSAVRGLAYVARDILYLATVFYVFHNYATPEYVPNYYARFALWGFYTFIQGCIGTGAWVLAHECGHQSFSTSKTLNDTVGWLLHSSLLVPYFSWKISHSKHHKATGNIDRDMVFNPKTRTEFAKKMGYNAHDLHELVEETPIYTALHFFGQQLAGWPMYLMSNITGHNNHEKQVEGKGKGKKNGWFTGVNHFQPSSPLYEKRDEHLILLSDLGFALAAAACYAVATTFGWKNWLVWYFIPYLWVNHWLVAITYLQHTDPSLPHYTTDSWNYVRGAAATIDREFGFIGRHLMHGIIETHVLHHYVSTIPFYHADEATEAIKKVMGRHYRSDTRGGSIGFVKAMWSSARWCQWVEPSESAKGDGKGVLFYRNHNGLGVPPMKMSEQDVKDMTAHMRKGIEKA